MGYFASILRDARASRETARAPSASLRGERAADREDAVSASPEALAGLPPVGADRSLPDDAQHSGEFATPVMDEGMPEAPAPHRGKRTAIHQARIADESDVEVSPVEPAARSAATEGGRTAILSLLQDDEVSRSVDTNAPADDGTQARGFGNEAGETAFHPRPSDTQISDTQGEYAQAQHPAVEPARDASAQGFATGEADDMRGGRGGAPHVQHDDGPDTSEGSVVGSGQDGARLVAATSTPLAGELLGAVTELPEEAAPDTHAPVRDVDGQKSLSPIEMTRPSRQPDRTRSGVSGSRSADPAGGSPGVAGAVSESREGAVLARSRELPLRKPGLEGRAVPDVDTAEKGMAAQGRVAASDTGQRVGHADGPAVAAISRQGGTPRTDRNARQPVSGEQPSAAPGVRPAVMQAEAREAVHAAHRESEARVVAAQAFPSGKGADPRPVPQSRKAPQVERKTGPDVHIGQIDVLIQGSSPGKARRSVDHAAPASATCHYVKGL